MTVKSPAIAYVLAYSAFWICVWRYQFVISVFCNIPHMGDSHGICIGLDSDRRRCYQRVEFGFGKSNILGYKSCRQPT